MLRYCIMANASNAPNDKIEAAESIITLLARLNVSKFPWEERIGLAVAQTRAMREWIEAIRSARSRLRLQRLFIGKRRRGSAYRTLRERRLAVSWSIEATPIASSPGKTKQRPRAKLSSKVCQGKRS